MNVIATIFCAFCALVALNTVFGLLFQSFALIGWLVNNLGWMWLAAAVGGIWLATK
jgi:hypothetical protein